MGGGWILEEETFIECGPNHLEEIDWENSDYRTSVTSSLVKGVYTLERYRQQNRPMTLESQAWWEFFHFSLIKTLRVDSDGSISVAIYEYNYKDTNLLGKHPHYVVAFRGTLFKPKTFSRDVQLDIRLLLNLIHGKRMRNIIDEIKTMVYKYGHETIWLAGHSLGAGMALFAGKTLARLGYPLESYIFNPLTAVTSLKVLKIDMLKHMARVVGNVTRATIVTLIKGEEDESFMRLVAWRPYLYVNPTDVFCSEYIGYFEERKRMSDQGLPVNLSTRYIGMNPFSSGESSQPLHILPSAYLMTNTAIWESKHGVFISLLERMVLKKRYKAHQIRQWWVREPKVKCELFELDGLASPSQ